jgi:hypothetical protein
VSENPSIPLPPVVDHKDRRVGLLVFGILEILLGLMCVLMAGVMVLGQVMLSRTPGTFDSRMILPAVFVYLGLAAVFVSLGIGSIRCRRWARALLLILAWPWLCVGVISVPVMGFVMPGMLAHSQVNGGPGLPHGALVVIVVFQLLFMTVLMVAIPGALAWFYGSRHVKATCQTLDPVRRWTDACPLPVLGIACFLWLGSISMLIYPFIYGGVLPVFGTVVTGVPGMLLAFVLAAVWLWLGVTCYHSKITGWWALLIVLLLFVISNFITFMRVDIMDLYRRMGLPETQLEIIRRQGWISNTFMLWNSVVWVVPMLAYLFWAKRFFRPQARS